jgi:hypothetical protein
MSTTRFAFFAFARRCRWCKAEGLGMDFTRPFPPYSITVLKLKTR